MAKQLVHFPERVVLTQREYMALQAVWSAARTIKKACGYRASHHDTTCDITCLKEDWDALCVALDAKEED